MKQIRMMAVALLLCLAVLFVGCTDDDQPKLPDDDPDHPIEGETPDDPTSVPFSLTEEDGSCRYVVLRDDYATSSSPEVKAAVSIRDALQVKLGTTVDIQTDYRDRRDTELTDEKIAALYEICVGSTNRPESQEVKASLDEYSWAIRVVGNKIVIVGDSAKATALAAQVFIDTYLADGAVISETLNITQTYTPDPTDIKLEDKSTGNMNPTLITTVYPTDDMVIADVDVVRDGYAVDPTGVADSTAGIQKALNDVSRAGGGTVWLPKGVYVISDSITVPAFVTLRGDWQDPDEGNEYGTIISVWQEGKSEYAAGKAVTSGTFMLGGSGGVVGLTVYYPNQSLTNVQNYPFTFYTTGQGTSYMLSTVKNVTVINGYRGIGACCTPSGAHEQLTVENFKGTFLYCGTEVYNQADVGTWQDVVISPSYWQNALTSEALSQLHRATLPTGDEIAAYVKANAIGLKLGDLEWTEFESLKVDGCKIGIEIVQGKRIQFAGSLYDTEILNCGQGLVVHDLDPRWGMVIARSTIENGIYNETSGMVKLCGVKTTGTLEGEIRTTDANVDLSAFDVNYKASYQKPNAALWVLDKISSKEDASAAIQALLDEAGKTGGVVYIPAGQYRLEKPLTVPAGVELRGAASVATRDQSSLSAGTIFKCYYGDDDNSKAEDQAFITLAGDGAGLNGIEIIYPENGPLSKNLNTTYAVRGTASHVYMVNCCISAAAYGVDFRNCDDHLIKKVSTCCYYNTFIVGGKGGVISGCLQNGTVIYRTGASGLVNWSTDESQIWNQLFDPITRKDNMYIIVDGATDQQIYNTFIYGCASMVVNRNSENTLAVNIGSDNIGSDQLVMESGSMTVINSMRYNGTSYNHQSGRLALYNRITIGNKNEEVVTKP